MSYAVASTRIVSADVSESQSWMAHAMSRKGKSVGFQSRDNPNLALDVFRKAALTAISRLAASP